MIAPYDTCSIFAGDTLLHIEVPYRPYGFAVSDTPFRLRHDGWSGLLLLLCLLLAASLVLRLRKKFRELLQGIFFPIQGRMDEPVTDDPLRYSTRLVAVCLLSLSAAMVIFSYTQYDVSYYPFPGTPYLLFGAFFILCIVYFIVKRLMNNFVNWIFFREEKIFTWQRVYTFLLTAESILFLVLALTVSYLPIPPYEMLLMTLFIVSLVKFLLLFKTYQIFFSKLYGTLHLIVYFCTLELIPLLVLQQTLTYAECLLEIKL